MAQLFEDMQMMVEEQGQTIDQIEQNAQDTTKDLEQGNKHVDKAIILARSTRAVSFGTYTNTLCDANHDKFLEKMVLFLYYYYSRRCNCHSCLVVWIWPSCKLILLDYQNLFFFC